MSKIKAHAVAFFNKHFVKWKFLQSLVVVPYEKMGKCICTFHKYVQAGKGL